MPNEVSLQYIWPDGQRVVIRVEADSAYPDALDQARSTAVRGFKDAMTVLDDLDEAEHPGAD